MTRTISLLIFNANHVQNCHQLRGSFTQTDNNQLANLNYKYSHVLSLSNAVPSANDTLLCCVIGGLSSERIGDEDDNSKQIIFKKFYLTISYFKTIIF